VSTGWQEDCTGRILKGLYLELIIAHQRVTGNPELEVKIVSSKKVSSQTGNSPAIRKTKELPEEKTVIPLYSPLLMKS
jgi:hypothetical protein